MWVHEADKNWDTQAGSDLEFRRDYVRLIAARENKHYDYEPEQDIRPWDCTQMSPGGLTVDGLCDFVDAIAREERSVLVIINTKACARVVYEALKTRQGPWHLFHLSTNMCARNRQDVFDEVKQALGLGEPVICVSTQLIEAGLNLSFRAVIRSLAGLDSAVQAAGRCNRHGEINFKRRIYVGNLRAGAKHRVK